MVHMINPYKQCRQLYTFFSRVTSTEIVSQIHAQTLVNKLNQAVLKVNSIQKVQPKLQQAESKTLTY
jgi:hypothetical protein